MSGRRWGKRKFKADSYPDQRQFAGYTMEDWDDTKPDSFYHDTRVGIATKVMTRSEAARAAALARWGKYTPKPQAAKPARRRSGGKGKDPAAVARQQQRDQEHTQDRAQRQQDRADRLARQTQRDEERKRDRLQRVGDRASRQMERALREQEKKRQAEDRAKKGGGGGGSGNKKQEQAAREAQRRAERAAALAARRADARRRAQQGEKRDQERRTEQAQRRADQQSREQRRTQAAVQRDTARQQREQEAADRRRVTTPEIADAARRLSAGEQVNEAEQDTLIRNGLARRGKDGALTLTSTGLRASRQKEAPAFAVFKDASGKLRWIARSTTAYRDRDREALAMRALDADSQRMTATKQFGPLRWWHVGRPDPYDPATPWGPGIDLGDCDFSMQIGPVRAESGTFYDGQIGQRIAAQADQFELSPGFFHPANQPQPDGTFTQIQTFERSLVPIKYGRASNLFTGLMVKEQRMEPQEIERRLKAMGEQLGLPAEQVAQFAAQISQTEKSAQQQGITLKSADTQPVYTAPDGTLGLVVDGQWVALKAAAMPMPMPPESDAEAKADMPMEDTPMDPAAEMSYLGDMDPNEYWGEIDQRLARIEQALNIEDRISKAFGEVKSLLGGYATKDAGRAAEITALKEQQAALDKRLKELEGDQPAVTLPSEIEAALKSSGPQAPPDPAAPQIPNDPNRPFAPVVARLAPELYSQEPWNGWPSAGS